MLAMIKRGFAVCCMAAVFGLGAADARIWGQGAPADPFAVAQAMKPHIAAHLAAGGRLHQITRHMLGLFHGRPGARGWRRRR